MFPDHEYNGKWLAVRILLDSRTPEKVWKQIADGNKDAHSIGYQRPLQHSDKWLPKRL